MFASSETNQLAKEVTATLEAHNYHYLLRNYLDSEQASERMGASGTPHRVEVTAFWEDKPRGPLRVVVEVTPLRGWRGGAETSFIKPPPEMVPKEWDSVFRGPMWQTETLAAILTTSGLHPKILYDSYGEAMIGLEAAAIYTPASEVAEAKRLIERAHAPKKKGKGRSRS